VIGNHSKKELKKGQVALRSEQHLLIPKQVIEGVGTLLPADHRSLLLTIANGGLVLPSFNMNYLGVGFEVDGLRFRLSILVLDKVGDYGDFPYSSWTEA
jgi:hypothetical protein